MTLLPHRLKSAMTHIMASKHCHLCVFLVCKRPPFPSSVSIVIKYASGCWSVVPTTWWSTKDWTSMDGSPHSTIAYSQRGSPKNMCRRVWWRKGRDKDKQNTWKLIKYNHRTKKQTSNVWDCIHGRTYESNFQEKSNTSN